jgi:hypothetical protein
MEKKLMRTAVVEQERGAGLLLAEQRRQGLGVPWPRAGKSKGEGKNGAAVPGIGAQPGGRSRGEKGGQPWEGAR